MLNRYTQTTPNHSGDEPEGLNRTPGAGDAPPPFCHTRSHEEANPNPNPNLTLTLQVMSLKDSIAHLEQEMLHHTSVTHGHMKKLAALINFQDESFQEPITQVYI
jgi:hypothetical protein